MYMFNEEDTSLLMYACYYYVNLRYFLIVLYKQSIRYFLHIYGLMFKDTFSLFCISSQYDIFCKSIGFMLVFLLLNQSNKSEKVNYFRKDLEPKVGKRDKLRAIEELLMQETFSR